MSRRFYTSPLEGVDYVAGDVAYFGFGSTPMRWGTTVEWKAEPMRRIHVLRALVPYALSAFTIEVVDREPWPCCGPGEPATLIITTPAGWRNPGDADRYGPDCPDFTGAFYGFRCPKGEPPTEHRW